MSYPEDLIRAQDAIGALEVRSSKFEYLRHKPAREQDLAAGKAGGRETLIFTVKVEDLKIVYRWIERTNKPQAYVQVFFDTVFMINVLIIFLIIFRIIACDDGFKIKKPKKSQEKITICGERIGRFSACLRNSPWKNVRPLVLGRHDAYVVPVGGDLQVDPGRIEALLLG